MSEEKRIDNDWPIIYSHTSRGGGTGGWHHLCRDAVAGVALNLIEDGEDDVASGITFLFAVLTSGGAWVGGSGSCANGGSVNLYAVGANILTLAVTAGGAVTVQRTGGALTYNVGLLAVWQ